MVDHQYYESNTYVSYDYVNENMSNDIFIKEKDGDSVLIELYRERPFLYNKAHRDFKNKIVKDNAWNEISKIMRDKNYGNWYTSEYCQTRCLSLRNQYNREKRILNSQYKSGNGASTHKPFAFYSQLSFLDDFVKRRRSHSNVKLNSVTSASSIVLPSSVSNEVLNIKEKSNDSVCENIINNPEDKDKMNDEKNKENTPQVKRKCATEIDLNVSNLKPVKYRKNKIDETKELEHMFSSISQRIINVLDSKPEDNEDEAFTRFITAHLTNLPQQEKNIRKKMITDALFSPLQMK